MSTTINNVVNVLPADTLVFCGHEYTADNAAFAAWVEPDNQAVKELVRLAPCNAPFCCHNVTQLTPLRRCVSSSSVTSDSRSTSQRCLPHFVRSACTTPSFAAGRPVCSRCDAWPVKSKIVMRSLPLTRYPHTEMWHIYGH